MFTRQQPFSKKTKDLPDTPSPDYTAAQIKNYIQTPSDENKAFVDGFLNEIEAPTGASNVGAKNADGTDSNVQSAIDEKATNTRVQDAESRLGMSETNISALQQTTSDLETNVEDNTNRVNNIVASTGESNTEIVDARYDSVNDKTFNYLGERLDETTSQLAENTYKWITTKKYENLVSNGDWYPALLQAYTDTPEGGTLFIHQMLDISQTLVVDKAIQIITPHAEEDALKSSGLRKTTNIPVLHIKKRGVKVVNLFVTSAIKESGDATEGIIIGDVDIQAQNTVFDNVYVKGVGGDGVLLQNANNCQLHLSVINNGGKGLNITPVGTWNNASGNMFTLVNSFGNGDDGVYANNCEGNFYFITSQSNTGWGFNGESIWNSLIFGYTELNGSGAVNLSSNSSGNFTWGKFRETGVSIPVNGDNRGENPNFTNYFLEDVTTNDVDNGYQNRFIMPRFAMLPQYKPPFNPTKGEVFFGSVGGYDDERWLRVYDDIVWQSVATREYSNRRRNGVTNDRPLDVRPGSDFFDTLLGKPIWCKSAGATWVEFVINSGATAAGTLTLTLDGTSFIVKVENGDTIEKIVNKIQKTFVSGWYPRKAGLTAVQFESIDAGDRTGVNSFDGGTSGVTATVTKLVSGSTPVWVDATGTTV